MVQPERGAIDVLIPTAGKRMDGLVYQVNAFINQSYHKITTWVLVDHDDFDYVRVYVKDRIPRHSKVEIIKIPDEWRGNYGHSSIRYAIEKLPLEGMWFNTSGDDDCVMEWGIEELVINSDGVDMVIGTVLPVRRDYGYTDRILGKNIALGEITGSCCLYRTSKVREIGYPSMQNHYNADWELIEKMMEGTFRKIESVIYVMPQDFQGW